MLEITPAMFDATYTHELERLMKEDPNDEKVADRALEATCRKLGLTGQRRFEMVNVFRDNRTTMIIGVWRSRRSQRRHWTDEVEDRHEAIHSEFLPPLTGGH